MSNNAEKAIVSNPVHSFRMPDAMQRQTGLTHFTTDRDDVYNEQGLASIYPGDFTYLPDPTLEIDMALWEDNDENDKSIAMYFRMVGKDGFNVAMAGDFKVSDRLALAWKGDGPEVDGKPTGRITLAGRSKKTMVLMWRTGEKADAAHKRRLIRSDELQMTAEEKAAQTESELSDRLAPLGATVRVSLEDDDGTDKPALPQTIKKRR